MPIVEMTFFATSGGHGEPATMPVMHNQPMTLVTHHNPGFQMVLHSTQSWIKMKWNSLLPASTEDKSYLAKWGFPSMSIYMVGVPYTKVHLKGTQNNIYQQ